MLKKTQHKISRMQFIFIVHGAQVGLGILGMPRKLGEQVSTDGWMSIIIGWALSVITSLIAIQLSKSHPDKTLFEMIQKLLGHWLGMLLNVVIILYFLYITLMILNALTGYIKVWLLPTTPYISLFLLLLLPGYVVLRGGIHILGRFSELTFYLTLILPVIVTLSLKEAHWFYLLPFPKHDWLSITGAARTTLITYVGYEICMLIYPNLKNKKFAALDVSIANTLTLLVNLHVTVVCFLFFSPDQLARYIWPVLNTLKVVEFRFLERFDIIFLAFYVYVITTSWLPYLYAFFAGTTHLLPKIRYKTMVLTIFFSLLFLSFWVQPTFFQMTVIQTYFDKYGLYFSFGLPVFMYAVLLIHRLVGRLRT